MGVSDYYVQHLQVLHLLLLHCYSPIVQTSLHRLLTFSNNPVRPSGSLLLHTITLSLTHLLLHYITFSSLSSTAFVRQLPLRLQCPSRIWASLYLTSLPRHHSTSGHSNRLGIVTSAARATPSALESTTPTSSSPRDPGGETLFPGLTEGRD